MDTREPSQTRMRPRCPRCQRASGSSGPRRIRAVEGVRAPRGVSSTKTMAGHPRPSVGGAASAYRFIQPVCGFQWSQPIPLHHIMDMNRHIFFGHTCSVRCALKPLQRRRRRRRSTMAVLGSPPCSHRQTAPTLSASPHNQWPSAAGCARCVRAPVMCAAGVRPQRRGSGRADTWIRALLHTRIPPQPVLRGEGDGTAGPSRALTALKPRPPPSTHNN